MQQSSLTLIARAGYAARGVVYLLIGGLAMLSAAGYGGKTADSKGALVSLVGEPWGFLALIVIGLGLFGYALWRLVQAFLDTDDHGRDGKGVAIRGSLFVSAVSHTLLGIYAISLPFTLQSSGGSGSEDAAEMILRQPFGRYLLAAVALTILGAGVAHIWKGLSGRFKKHLVMSDRLMAVLGPFCGFGLAARGVVFLIIGSFFVYAAYTFDADQAGGAAAALHWLRTQEYGAVLLLVIAAGLFAFGSYSMIEAIWRRIDTAEVERQAERVSRGEMPS
jgi:hypothetical protein